MMLRDNLTDEEDVPAECTNLEDPLRPDAAGKELQKLALSRANGDGRQTVVCAVLLRVQESIVLGDQERVVVAGVANGHLRGRQVGVRLLRVRVVRHVGVASSSDLIVVGTLGLLRD